MSPLLALAALLALLYTIIVQRQEQKETAEQFVKSHETLQKQISLLSTQNFEATFFRMLGLYTQLVAEMQIEREVASAYVAEGTDRYARGREAIELLQKRLCSDYIEHVNRGDDVETKLVAIDFEYKRFYESYGNLVGHYFRTIYNILKFVDSNSQIERDRKKFYANILRAQLSKFELGLMFYNSVSSFGRSKLLRLIRSYDVFKHLEVAVLHDESDLSLLDQALNARSHTLE